MAWVGWELKDHLIPTPPSSWSQYEPHHFCRQQLTSRKWRECCREFMQEAVMAHTGEKQTTTFNAERDHKPRTSARYFFPVLSCSLPLLPHTFQILTTLYLFSLSLDEPAIGSCFVSNITKTYISISSIPYSCQQSFLLTFQHWPEHILGNTEMKVQMFKCVAK